MKIIYSGQEQFTLFYGKQSLNGKPYSHQGLDIVRQNNRLDWIVACQTGQVTKVVNNVKGRDLNKGYGNYIELKHANSIYTRYCHLKYGSIKVKKGQIVKKRREDRVYGG